MAKKSKRKYGNKGKKRRLSAAQTYRPAEGRAPQVAVKSTRRRRTVQVKHHIPTEEELAEEYRYVLTDLKRIGILALVMLVLLIALAFVLV